MVGKLKNKSERFFGIVHVCACKCGTRVAGLSRKVIQSLQIVCTRLGSILGVCFCPKMPSTVEVFLWVDICYDP